MSWTLDQTIDIASFLTLLMIVFIVYYNHKQYKQMERQIIIQNQQLSTQNEQIKHNYFTEFTKRYQNISLHFPENINEDTFRYEKLEKNIRDKTMRYMRVYFDLCSEEFFLHEKKYLDEDVWNEWKEGMKVAFNKKAFKDAWEKVTNESEFYVKFKDFVNKDLIEK